MNLMLIKIRSASAAHVGFNELDGRAGWGDSINWTLAAAWQSNIRWTEGLAKIDAIQRKIEEAATTPRVAGRQ